jgi:hypothetical protein
VNEDFDLGRLLGRREAFSVIAARCSAADAATLRKVREEKAYLSRCKDWEEFCTTYLHLSKAHANRIIQLLDEFGPAYFDLAQLTRISPDTYRSVAPSIQDDSLHFEGEEIALIPANAAKVAAIVAEIRQAAAARRNADPAGNLERQILRAFERLITMAAGGSREQVAAAVSKVRTRLDELELQLR